MFLCSEPTEVSYYYRVFFVIESSHLNLTFGVDYTLDGEWLWIRGIRNRDSVLLSRNLLVFGTCVSKI